MLGVGAALLFGGLLVSWLLTALMARGWGVQGFALELMNPVFALLGAAQMVGAVLVGGAFVVRALLPPDGDSGPQ